MGCFFHKMAWTIFDLQTQPVIFSFSLLFSTYVGFLLFFSNNHSPSSPTSLAQLWLGFIIQLRLVLQATSDATSPFILGLCFSFLRGHRSQHFCMDLPHKKIAAIPIKFFTWLNFTITYKILEFILLFSWFTSKPQHVVY